MIAGSIISNKLVLIPSHPQLFSLGRFFIVKEINSASTGLKVKNTIYTFILIVLSLVFYFTFQIVADNCKKKFKNVFAISCSSIIDSPSFRKWCVCFTFIKNFIYRCPSIFSIIPKSFKTCSIVNLFSHTKAPCMNSD